jgi:hypothetical protein
MWNVVERRVERSSSLDNALELLLRTQRARGEMDLMLLATADGVIVASDGPSEVCEELAAYAPLLARGLALTIDSKRLRGVSVHAFMVGRQEMVLATRGGVDDRLTSALALASIQGATRILRG